ncbi:hypothetical protein [Allopontixanthobacter sp.]|uniref:hypothetical protein n=1 Tax=Allopontixanthobacter sp. TaxID=2906452 RepID=UPI002AB8DD75|nr:hypothetical protein [Allopontixanthobacter sp.]MDZ4308869.1 hypothetical protein [Allopontixanthobacter sp.]
MNTAIAQAAPNARESTYADLVDLADAANLVLRVEIRKQAEVKAERAPGLSPGMARLYIEADTLALLTGNSPVGESVKYLVDVPLDAKGRAPKLKKQEMLLFAKAVPGRPGEIQLVGQGAQIRWTPEMEARVRPILSGLVAPDAPPVVTGVRDALSVEGNLVGESETQLFLSTRGDGPVSVTVIRRPGQQPTWGVSFSEIVDQSAVPPQPETLEWYRLACFLPEELPGEANLSRDAGSRAQAAADYRFMMSQLGPCPRNRL